MEPQRFHFLLVEEFSHLAFSCAIEPLRIANLISGKELYAWSLASLDGARATCSNGSVTLVGRNFDEIRRGETVFVLSGINVYRHIDRPLLNAIRKARSIGCRIGALCSGAYVLAKAGLLDDVRTAVHWDFHATFDEEFPAVDLVTNVFVADAPIITASGGTATADLMLHLIERDHGHDLSVAVADQMVYNAVRAPDAQQRVSLQARLGMRNRHLAQAIRMMSASLEAPLPPAAIAQDIGISVRQLERLFGRYMNLSPAKFAMELRMEKAQRLLVQTDMPVTEIGLACGFTSMSHFSRVYRAHFGVPPKHQRARIV